LYFLFGRARHAQEVAPQPALEGSEEESSVSVLIVDAMGCASEHEKDTNHAEVVRSLGGIQQTD